MLREVSLEPIGTVIASTFQHKWATPRQGQLTPDSMSEIQIKESLNYVKPGNRVAIVWWAHLNSENFNPLKGKIKPPKLGGKSIGVFATRGVHRPSSIGLSFCTVLTVNETLVVTGGDMIVGTPILAIHLASTLLAEGDAITTLQCPPWTRDVEVVKVFWSLASMMSVTLINKGINNSAIVEIIDRILSQDPRSIHSTQNHQDPIYEIKVHANGMEIHVIYRHIKKEIQVLFVTQARLVVEYPERSDLWLKRLVEKLAL